MDTVYLQREVGAALSKGLAAVAISQPHDPVEYLGQFLLAYVKNQVAEGQVKKEEEQLLVEKQKHAEALEWERIRIEQEEKTKQEEILAIEHSKQREQLELARKFEERVKLREESIAKEGTPAQQQLRPLTQLTEKVHVIHELLDENKAKLLEIFKSRNSNLTPDQPLAKILKAVVVLLGWHQLSELNDWSECKKIFRNPDLLSDMKKYSPLKRQTIHKFATSVHLTKDISAEEVKKTAFTTFLLWEFVTTCIKMRKTALSIRSERLKIPLIGDPEFADGEAAGDDEEEDLEEELRHSENARPVDEGEAEEEGDDDGDDDDDDDDDDD